MKALLSLCFLIPCLELAVVSPPSHAGAAQLQATIVDDQTGQPLAARIRAADDCGRVAEVEGIHSHVEYLGK
jgi:hypothetical protein